MDNALNVLLVDDDADHSASLAHLLEGRGHRVRTVTDGLKGLLYLDDSVDMLVTDLQMPGLDGAALVDTLRDRFPELPVVLISGGMAHQHQAEGLRERAQAFFTKPIPVPELLAAMEQLVATQR